MSDQMSYREALQKLASLLASRWVPAVLIELTAGRLRYSDLLAEINDAATHAGRKPLTEKVFVETLKALEGAQLIANRRQSNAATISSYYELTTHGKALLRALRPAIKWAANYHAAIANDRASQ